jgi:S1-C subfamily serine protease
MDNAERPPVAIIVLVLLVMVAGGFMAAGYMQGRPRPPAAPKSTGSVAPIIPPAPAPILPVATVDPQAAIDLAKRSTVMILHKVDNGVSCGSGFSVGNSGVIVTNRHVVTDDQMENPVDCIVCFFCGSGHEKAITIPAADIHLADEEDGDGNERNDDLAVLKIPEDIVKPLSFGDSDGVRNTQMLYAIGFPHGTEVLTPDAQSLPEPSVLEEVVQRLQRNSARNVSVMQLGGAMTHGDSGGPVIDETGKVVGMCESVEQDASIGYAIPSLFIKRLIVHAGFPAGEPATPSMTGPVTLATLQAQLDNGSPAETPASNGDDEIKWKTYTDAAGRFALDYPITWEVDPPTTIEPGVNRIRIQYGEYTSVVVDVSDTPDTASPKDSWREASDELAKKWGPAYRLAGIDDFPLGGEPGAIWMFTLQRSGEPKLIKTDIGATHSGKGYALLCTAPSDDFKNRLDEFDHIVNSFGWTPARSSR